MFDPIVRIFGVGMQKTDEPAEEAVTAGPEGAPAEPEIPVVVHEAARDDTVTDPDPDVGLDSRRRP